MIIPMTKFAFLVYHQEYPNFLENLQNMGLIHVSEKHQHIGEKEKNLLDLIAQLKGAISFLEGKQPSDQNNLKEFSLDDFLARLSVIRKENEQLENQEKKVEKELKDVRPWGNFSASDLNRLASLGLTLKYYSITEKRFDPNWIQEFPIEEIAHIDGTVYFVAIYQEGDAAIHEAIEMKPPVASFSEKTEELALIRQQLDQIVAEYSSMASQKDLLEMELLKAQNSLVIQKVWDDTLLEADEKVMLLEGWAPTEQRKVIEEFAETNGVYYLAKEGKVEDNPPILLKNNRFAKLFEPIGALFSLPIYNEIDLTSFFAPFFMMFFGFCLADAGYGVILILAATIFKSRVKADLRPIMSLIQWLGLATIIFGIITGTLFGVDLLKLNLGWASSLHNIMLDSQKLFRLALMVGAVQILFGMAIKAFNLAKQNNWWYAVSTIGWFIFISFTAACYALGGIVPELKPWGHLHLIVAAVTGIAIFFFNSPGKNPFLNFGLGIWDSYNMATGLLGDVLSYIRLFALSLSGAILGGVYNSLAFGMAPDIIIVKQIVIVLILVVGHSINLFMGGLGALVHPMRLTFVEFYKNANFTGGGTLYNPFKKNN
jgi:Archaeal/vacuolar-type H+-ATPase subunit I